MTKHPRQPHQTRVVGWLVSEAILQRALGQLGHATLRTTQADVIAAVLRQEPVIAVMPTGAGKSLCYQLPALILAEHDQVTVVVSPLIALMKDQVDGLTARGIAAAALTSAANPEEQREIIAKFAARQLAILYVAPERFRSPRFMAVLRELRDHLALLAIDEAHCISEWGHDFRPDYRRLAEVITELRPARIAAFTATATPEVRDDIARQLGLTDARVFVKGFDRPNLTFSVEAVSGGAAKVARLHELIRLRAAGVALVYAATRKNAETYATELKRRGLRARVYHAGLGDDVREKNQDTFMAGKLDVIVATNAFGMGVDKSDIRLVIHADMPRSPEAYYQEAGRGGRDGGATQCVLLFSHADVRLHEYLIAAGAPSADALRAAWRAVRDAGSVPARRLEEFLQSEVPETTGAMAATMVRLLERHELLGRNADDHVVATRPSAEAVPLDPEGLARRANNERAKLRVMVNMASGYVCRRRFLLSYFGDSEWTDRTTPCSACDVCAAMADGRTDGPAAEPRLLTLLNLVATLGGRFGRKRIAALACGDDEDARFVELAGRGDLRAVGASGVMDWLRALETNGYIEASRGEYPTVGITARGKSALSDGELPGLTMAPTRSGSPKARRRTSKPRRNSRHPAV